MSLKFFCSPADRAEVSEPHRRSRRTPAPRPACEAPLSAEQRAALESYQARAAEVLTAPALIRTGGPGVVRVVCCRPTSAHKS